jgi:multiple sugar transport system substrate-binding protein
MNRISLQWAAMAWLIALTCLGCNSEQDAQQNPDTHPQDAKLSLLVLDDPELADAIRRQWTERGEGELTVNEGTAKELLDATKPSINADAVIYPSGMIGQLIESNLIVPLPAKTLRDPNLAWSDILDLVRLREATWDRKAYALPLGSPQFALFYRADVWEKLELKPPTTWEQYAAAVAKLRDAAAKDSAIGFQVATAEPLAPNWAGQMLLARAAGYARHRNFLSVLFDLETMQPLIDGPPFVRALDELFAAAANPAALEWGPQDTLEQLLNGHVAAAIGSCAPGNSLERPTAEPQVKISVVELPGAEVSYDRQRQTWDSRDASDVHVTLLMSSGRFASVSRRAANQQATANLLVWITGKEWSAQLAPVSSHVTLYRRQHLEKPENWITTPNFSEAVRREYADVVSQSLSRPESVLSVRLPGRDEYLVALDEAVSRVVRGEASSKDALQEAAAKWNVITDRIGRDKQKEAYRRSLGL